jgi:tRNA-guanine family transglycosylase
MPVTVEQILDLQQTMKCDLYETLYKVIDAGTAQPMLETSDDYHSHPTEVSESTADCVSPSTAASDRILEAALHTEQWAERMLHLARMRQTPGRALLSISAKGSEAQLTRRATWVQTQLSQYGDLIGGFNLVGLGVYDTASVDLYCACRSMVEKLREIAPHLPVFCSGGAACVVDGSPPLVLRLIASGVDVIESRYPFVMAECGYALDLFHETTTSLREHSTSALYVSVRDVNWAEDARPLLLQSRSSASERHCSIGRTYARAYWYHLFRVHEMLGPILLSLHNVQQYLAFFEEIQKAIREDAFNAFCTRFSAMS